MKIPIRHCQLADEEHAHSQRQYAHVFHRQCICVADAFFDLPRRHQRGLMAHELGHLLQGDRRHSEADADHAVHQMLGIKVRYRDSRYGRRLQYA